MEESVARSFKGMITVLFLLVALSIAQAAPQSRIAQAIDSAQFVPLQGSAHPLARPEFDRGPVDPGMQLQLVSINFKKSAAQQKALDTLLAQQHDRSSDNYHKWLTPAEYADRFGMAPADIAKVSAWLVSQGFTVNRVARGRTRISFTGSAAQIESVFHSEIHQYEVNGEKHYANASEISVPAALVNVVLGFTGLNDFRPKPHLHRMPVSPKFTDSPGVFALVPEDFATIYSVKALYDQGIDGTGQTIAVAGGSAITLSNINTFRSLAGLPVNPPTIIIVPGGGTPVGTNQDAQLEAYLDLEWAGAVAKNAQILFVNTGPNDPEGPFDAVQYSVDNDLAPVISISFGNCEAGLTKPNSLIVQGWAQEANSQGQTIVAASGDTGAADCDGGDDSATQGLAVDVPAAIPEVTGVGGSEFLADVANPTTYWNGTNDPVYGSAKKYIPEEVWDDTPEESDLASGGGGVSTFFLIPAWQSGAGFITSGRNVPDIALNASNFHDFYLLCIGTDPQDNLTSCTNGFLDSMGEPAGVGGTSAGAPTFAGMVALLDQAIDPTGVGNVNLELYPLAASTPAAFNDITTGSNMVPCTTGSPSCPSTGPHPGQLGYSAAAGYDQASGLGSVNADTLVTNWPGFSGTATFTVGGTPVTIAAAGAPGTSTITVDPLNSFSGTVTLTCTPPPSVLITCSITPSVTVTGSNATATLTINTTAAHVALASAAAPNRPKGMGWFMVSGAGLFAGVLVMGVPSRRRKTTAMFAMLLFAFMVTGVACGGGSSSGSNPTTPGTPAGIYTVGVSAVSGSITRPLSVFVTVK
jgi:subtilase family serine protease